MSEGVTGWTGPPVGADDSPTEGAAGRRGGWPGVVRSTASPEVAVAFGVEGAWWPSAATSMASSPWRGLGGLEEESGEASGRGGGTGRARHSREKANYTAPGGRLIYPSPPTNPNPGDSYL